MTLPTASAIDRARACLGSATLPRVKSTNAYATRGTTVHAFIAEYRKHLAGGLLHEDARAWALNLIPLDEPEAKRLCEAIPLESLPSGGHTEISFAWNYFTDTARVLGEHLDRAYDVTADEYAGTADLAGVIAAEDLGIVVDWKSGYRDLGPAAESGQLQLLALAVSRVWNVSRVKVGYVYLREGEPYQTWATFSALDLAGFADDLVEMAERIADEGWVRLAAVDYPQLAVGDHCTYCDAFRACPAQTALVRAMLPELTLLDGTTELMTTVEMGEAFVRLQQCHKLYEVMDSAIRARAKVEPIPLPDGRYLRAVDWPVTVVDGNIALRVVSEERGPDVADIAVPRKATLASIERACGKDKTILSRLELEGGISRTHTTQVRVGKKTA